jgi:hypothetical protein
MRARPKRAHLEAQAMWPGKACTSGTSCVCCDRAAAPHTPRPKAMRVQPRAP